MRSNGTALARLDLATLPLATSSAAGGPATPAVRGPRRGLGWLLAVVVVVVAGAGLAGCGGRSSTATSTAGGGEPTTGSSASSAMPAELSPPSVGESVIAAAEAMQRSTPVRVTIPKIGAESSLMELGVESDGTLQVPPVSKPLQAGWYREGPTPGEIGPAVIAGHVDGMKRPGIFYRLRELSAGDAIFVARVDGTTATFVVTDKQQISKARFPTERVYGDTEGPELRLITCGGAFDRASHNYLDNIIIFAKLRR